MGTLLSAANWPIVGQIAILLGKVMNVIYNTLDNVLPTDHGLVGWSIIIYTILVLSLIHISEPTRLTVRSRMPSSA